MNKLARYGMWSAVGVAVVVAATCGSEVRAQSLALVRSRQGVMAGHRTAASALLAASPSAAGDAAVTFAPAVRTLGPFGISAAPAPASVSKPTTPGCPRRLTRGWLAQENRRAGTVAWHDARHTRAGTVNGYLSRVSAVCGDTVTAYLTSPIPLPDA